MCLSICKSLVVVLEHRKVSCLCAWALEIPCLCAWVLVIWDYIVSEISLEVQGGQDYFWFVEGTCIIALCLSSLSLLLCFYPLHIKSLLTTSEAHSQLLLNCDISRRNEEKANTSQPPFLCFSHLQTLQWCLFMSVIWNHWSSHAISPCTHYLK